MGSEMCIRDSDEADARFIRDYQEISELTPVFKEFTFEDITCENVSYGVGFFLGLPESPLEKVTLKNIDISYKAGAKAGEMAMTAWKEAFYHVGFVCENLKVLDLKNINFKTRPEKNFILRNVGSVEEENVTIF